MAFRTPPPHPPRACLGRCVGTTSRGGDAFTFIFGTTKPFEPDTIASIYPGGCGDYIARFTAALDETVAAGFILEENRKEILAVAAAGPVQGDRNL